MRKASSGLSRNTLQRGSTSVAPAMETGGHLAVAVSPENTSSEIIAPSGSNCAACQQALTTLKLIERHNGYRGPRSDTMLTVGAVM